MTGICLKKACCVSMDSSEMPQHNQPTRFPRLVEFVELRHLVFEHGSHHVAQMFTSTNLAFVI